MWNDLGAEVLKVLATAKVILKGMACCSRSPSLLSSVSSAHSHGSLSSNLYDVFFNEMYQKNILVVCAGNCFCVQLKLNVRWRGWAWANANVCWLCPWKVISSSKDHTTFLDSFDSRSVYVLAPIANKTATDAILKVKKSFPAGFVCRKMTPFQETWMVKSLVALSPSIISAAWGGRMAVIIAANVTQADCWFKSCSSLILLRHQSVTFPQQASRCTRASKEHFTRNLFSTYVQVGVPPLTVFWSVLQKGLEGVTFCVLYML